MGVDAFRRTSARFRRGHESEEAGIRNRDVPDETILTPLRRSDRIVATIRPVTSISSKIEMGLRRPSDFQKPLRVLDRTIDSHIKKPPSDLRKAPDPAPENHPGTCLTLGRMISGVWWPRN